MKSRRDERCVIILSSPVIILRHHPASSSCVIILRHHPVISNALQQHSVSHNFHGMNIIQDFKYYIE
ncbi:hypothetical protein STEG23_036996 [Scotinomys teguina]